MKVLNHFKRTLKKPFIEYFGEKAKRKQKCVLNFLALSYVGFSLLKQLVTRALVFLTLLVWKRFDGHVVLIYFVTQSFSLVRLHKFYYCK